MKDNFFKKLDEQISKRGKLKQMGLCNEVFESYPERRIQKPYLDVLELFEPSLRDDIKLRQQGLSTVYWGHEGDMYLTPIRKLAFEYTSLRKMLLAFCHVILNSET